VINESLKEDLFGKQSAIGKFIDFGWETGQMKPKVVGVIEDLKDRGDFVNSGNGIYFKMDTTNQENGGALLIKVKPGTDAIFESRLYKALSNTFRQTSIDIRHLENDRKLKNTQSIGPVIILGVVAGFFIINVALGLFGVLWYNINKRKSEIGLRRAIGASGGSVSRQLIGETLVLATFALIVGSFFAIQFPLLDVLDLPSGVYILALILAIMAIYLLVIVCSFYPGRQAAAIYPAVALHED
jgi:putative ABC transport system permease protein